MLTLFLLPVMVISFSRLLITQGTISFDDTLYTRVRIDLFGVSSDRVEGVLVWV